MGITDISSAVTALPPQPTNARSVVQTSDSTGVREPVRSVQAEAKPENTNDAKSDRAGSPLFED